MIRFITLTALADRSNCVGRIPGWNQDCIATRASSAGERAERIRNKFVSMQYMILKKMKNVFKLWLQIKEAYCINYYLYLIYKP
jgi:hypothetical protein